jgi:hypothetical protein
MIATDLFTEILRYIAWTILGLLFLGMLGVGLGTAAMRWIRRWEVRHGWTIYDWSRDGECDESDEVVLPIRTHDMYPRTHVSMPDCVPIDWAESWQ